MPIPVFCSCGYQGKIPEEMSGQRVLCPKCGTDISVPGPAPVPPPPPKPGAGPEPGSSPTPAAERRPCPYCAEPILPTAKKCPRCKSILDPALRAQMEGRAAMSDLAGAVPWEEAGGNVFGRYWRTWAAALFKPNEFFRGCARGGGHGPPLTYGMMTGFQMLIPIFALVMLLIIPLTMAGGERGAAVGVGLFCFIFAVCAIVIPISVILGLYIWSGIYHVCALILGGRGTFGDTMRIMSYAYYSTCWFGLLGRIPCFGYLISLGVMIWNAVIAFFGFRHMHGLSTGRAVVAVLLPFLLCLGLTALAFVTFAAAAMSTMRGY